MHSIFRLKSSSLSTWALSIVLLTVLVLIYLNPFTYEPSNLATYPEGKFATPRLYLHVGPHKTASSFIQKIIMDYGNNLAKVNYHWPSPVHMERYFRKFGFHPDKKYSINGVSSFCDY